MAFVEELLSVFKQAAGFPETDHKRPISLETIRGEHIYSDAKQEYKLLIPELERGISSVESLAMAVLEEATRRENETGKFMTVIFTDRGGRFYPDDKRRLDKWEYERCLSQQWKHLTQYLGRDMKHLDFVRFLQGLRPSVTDYISLMREYKKVTFDGKTSVTSQPIIEDGKGGSQVAFTLETKNGQTQAAMPGEIKIDLPYTRGSLHTYELTIELDVYLDDNNQVKFRPVCPDIEAVVEQAIADELEFFKEQTFEKLPELLVLLDY